MLVLLRYPSFVENLYKQFCCSAVGSETKQKWETTTTKNHKKVSRKRNVHSTSSSVRQGQQAKLYWTTNKNFDPPSPFARSQILAIIPIDKHKHNNRIIAKLLYTTQPNTRDCACACARCIMIYIQQQTKKHI